MSLERKRLLSREGNLNQDIRATFKFLYFIFTSPIAFVLYVFYKKYRKFLFVRIAVGAIGHLASESRIYLERALGNNFRGIAIIPFGNYSNIALIKEIKSRSDVTVIPRWLTTTIARFQISQEQKHLSISKIGLEDFAKLDLHTPFIQIPSSELINAKRALRNTAGYSGQPIILFCCRDSAFDLKLGRYSYELEYRNSNFEIFEFACRELYNQGFFPIRFGRVVNHSISENFKPFVFDYPNSPLNSERMDLVLSSMAKLIVSTGSGIEEIPALFNKDIIRINYLPISAFPISQNRKFYLPKILLDSESKCPLTISEIIDRNAHNLWKTREYSRSGILFDNNSQETIYESIIDFLTFKDETTDTYYSTNEYRHLMSMIPAELRQPFGPLISRYWENLKVTMLGK